MKRKNHFFEELYRNYEQKIYRTAYSILNNQEQAEDTTHDVFEELLHQLEKLKKLSEKEIKLYIIRITKNKAIDSYRRNQTKITYLERAEVLTEQEKTNSNVEEKLEELITKDQYKELKNQIPKKYQQTFVYAIYYGLSTKEVASILNEKEDTIRKRLLRVKKQIREILGGEGIG